MLRFILFSAFALYFYSAVAQISNNVSLLGHWDDNTLQQQSGVQYNDIWGYAVNGKEFALVGARQKVLFLDITNPSQITQIAAINGGSSTIWRDIKTYGTYAYSVADAASEGLMVFDLSQIDAAVNPTVTKVAQMTTHFTKAHNIFVDTDHGILYVAGANAAGGDLVVYDLKPNPAMPTFVRNINLPGDYIHDVYVKNHIAYCSHATNGLYIYDLSAITSVAGIASGTGTYTELGRIDFYNHQGYNHSSWAKGDYIVFADETHGKPLKVADASDLGDIEIIDYVQSNRLGVANPTSSAGSIPHNPFILGDMLVVSYYHEGVVFYDMSDPTNVTEIGYYDTSTAHTSYSGFDGCWGVYPYLPSGRVIASDDLNGLFVLDATTAMASMLPVSWEYVEAQAQDAAVVINWQTSQEVNNKGFWIERLKADNRFERLGFVHASETYDYSYTDKTAATGVNFYRIAQQDYDGSIHYSSLVSARIEKEKDIIGLYPNPVNSGSSFSVQMAKAASLKVDLLNMQGQVVQSYTAPSPKSMHHLRLPALSAGAYVLKSELQEFKLIIK